MTRDINTKDQCSFPLHFWLSVAAVVSVVVAVAVVAGAIDAAEPEPGHDAPAVFDESDKDRCQTRINPMKVILMNSFDEILLQLLAPLIETNSRLKTHKF